MVRTTPTGRTRAFAALLMLVTLVAGAGRGVPSAGASTVGPTAFRPGLEASDLRALGLVAPICHAGDGAGVGVASGVPTSPASPPHGCCDACALLAPAVLPTPPAVPTRATVALPADRGAGATPALGLPQQRGPRLTRGPPRG